MVYAHKTNFDKEENERNKTLDSRILALSYLIVNYISEYPTLNTFNEPYLNKIKNASRNMYSPDNHITIEKYIKYVLDMTFELANREQYDRIHDIVYKFMKENEI